MTDNISFVISLLQEIGKPLLILVVVLFLLPPVVVRLRKSGKNKRASASDVFMDGLERLIQRANHVLDDPVLLKEQKQNSDGDSKSVVLSAWDQIDSELKRLAQNQCQVDPDISPYPIDYVLFELEMRKVVGNTTIGFYRDLGKLKDIVVTMQQEEHIDLLSAAKYELLAQHVKKMLKQGPLPGIGGIF